MSLRLLLVWSGLFGAGIMAARTVPAVVFFAIGSLLITAGVSGSPRMIVRRSLLWSLPFLLPLLAVHGILNPAFDESLSFVGVPLRLDGTSHALLVFLRIFVLTLLAAAWTTSSADRLLRESAALGLPYSTSAVLAGAASLLEVIRARGHAVLTAQQARGVDTGPRLIKRIRAFPKIVLPVITMTLVDAEQRGTLLENRGFGLAMPPKRTPDPVRPQEVAGPSALLVLLIASALIS